MTALTLDPMALAAPEAEQIVLGSIIHVQGTGTSLAALATLTERDFIVPRHRTILGAVKTLHAAGEPYTTHALMAHLRANGQLAAVGGGDYLATLDENSQPASLNFFLDAVRDARLKRDLREYHERGLQDLGTGDTAADLLSRLAASSTSLIEGAPVAQAEERLDGILERVIAGIGDDSAGPEVATGLVDLDRLLDGGLYAGQLIIPAARPGVGKTVVGLQLALNAAVRQTPARSTLFISLEMSKEELTLRALASIASISLTRLRTGDLDESAWAKVRAAQQRLAAAPLYLIDDPDVTPAAVSAHASRIKARHRGDLGLVVVDYLQLMLDDQRDSRVEERVRLSNISRALKVLAKRLAVPVVALAQLNRDSEQRGDGRPKVSDLRGSGSLEQDADVVLLLHRPEMHDGETARVGELDIIVGKNRNGAQGLVSTAFQGHFCRVADMARE